MRKLYLFSITAKVQIQPIMGHCVIFKLRTANFKFGNLLKETVVLTVISSVHVWLIFQFHGSQIPSQILLTVTTP